MNLAEERTAVEQSKETGDDEREKRRAQIFGIFLNIIIRRKERERESVARSKPRVRSLVAHGSRWLKRGNRNLGLVG